MRARRDDPSGFAVRVWISALDSRLLATESLTRHATVQVVGDTWRVSPDDPLVRLPMPRLAAVVNGGSEVTDDQGLIDVAAPSVLGASASLNGQFVRVFNDAGPALVATTATTGAFVTLAFSTPADTALAQTTAYYWAQAAHVWARTHAPALIATPRSLGHTDVIVNWAGLNCNAFAAGSLIGVGAGAPCRNMATPTIVAHEMGHEIHVALANGALDAGFSEGFGDAVAAFLTGEPCLGPGFVAPGTCMRDVRDVTMWPAGTTTDPHEVGRPYAQFAWQLRLALGDGVATSLILGTAAAAPSDVPDAVYLTFVADDDDGLLGTCSPNQRALEAAADSRALPRPQTCRPAGDNATPTAHPDLVTLSEGAAAVDIDLLANDTDPDGDVLEIASIEPSSLGALVCDRARCRFTPFAGTAGTETLSYTAIDTFGGSATATLRIEIAAATRYQVTGFAAPIDMPSPAGLVWNSAKAGQAIPAKWQLSSDGQPVSDPASFAGLYSSPTGCASGVAAEDVIEEYAAGQSSLQYAGNGRWQFNWKAPASYRHSCRVMFVRFTDGSQSAVAYFTFK